MRHWNKLLLLLPIIAAACAAGAVSSTAIPVTLSPPPTLDFVGNCDNTHELEAWLQTSSLLLTDFQTQMNAAASQTQSEVSTSVIQLAKLRDWVFAAKTPDCAVQLQTRLGDAMNKAVAALQTYANGGQNDVPGTVADVNNQLDAITADQQALIKRMEDQYRKLALTPTPKG